MSPAPAPSRTTRTDPSRRRRPNRPGGGSGHTRRTAPSLGAGRRPANSSDRELEAALEEASRRPEPAARTFGQFGLPDALVTVLARRGLHEPFAIQSRILPDALTGRDVLGRAHTGSGKTLAFGLPALARLAASGTARRPGLPRALVVVPTRELASQVADVLSPLAHALGQRVTTVVGGLSMGRQIDQLRRGVDVVVATPGRLIDLMERNAASLSAVEITVLDEADHLADLGFLPAVRRLLDATPAGTQRMLLSATLDGGVDRLVQEYLREPAVHAVPLSVELATVMDHRVFTVRNEDKVPVAAEIAARPGRTLIFVRTKHGADRLAKQLGRAGVEAAAIHGNRNQSQRQRALDDFAAGSPRVLVATDVAARGIHVDDVDLVVHFDLPADSKDYLHRSGRTARAGASGTVLSLVETGQSREVARLHRSADVTATVDAVHSGHEAVRLVAASGTPIPVRPPRDPRPSRTAYAGVPEQSRGARSRRPARSSQRRRPA
jgi:superfamily II DNA/RNA helicase